MFCGALALPGFARTEDPIVKTLSPEAIKNAMQGLNLPRGQAVRDSLRPAGADLKIHAPQVTIVRGIEPFTFTLLFPITNEGRATSSSMVDVTVIADDIMGVFPRTVVLRRLPALRMGERDGVGAEIQMLLPSTVDPKRLRGYVAETYDRIRVRLDPVVTGPVTRRPVYRDANNTNNTYELRGTELVRLLGI